MKEQPGQRPAAEKLCSKFRVHQAIQLTGDQGVEESSWEE